MLGRLRQSRAGVDRIQDHDARSAAGCGMSSVSHNEHVEVEVTNDFLALTGVDWRAEVVPHDEAT